MTEDAKPKSDFSLLKLMAGLTALITAVAGLVGALTATGMFEDDDSGPTPTTVVAAVTTQSNANQTNTTQVVSEASLEQAVQDRVPINLAYAGDPFGCGLSLTVAVGDQTFQPIGINYQATNIAVGTQNYQISGLIACPTGGQCEATGSGQIEVSANKTFVLEWAETGFGLCEVWLRA